MPAKKRNFWILLTLLAVILAGARWLEFSQLNCQRSHCVSTSVDTRTSMPHIDAPADVDREPIAKNIPQVKRGILYSYPCSVRRAGVEGSIVARVLVDEHGEYLRHRVISRTHCGLAHRCERYLSQLEFIPAVRDHHQVAAWTNVELSFPY